MASNKELIFPSCVFLCIVIIVFLLILQYEENETISHASMSLKLPFVEYLDKNKRFYIYNEQLIMNPYEKIKLQSPINETVSVQIYGRVLSAIKRFKTKLSYMQKTSSPINTLINSTLNFTNDAMPLSNVTLNNESYRIVHEASDKLETYIVDNMLYIKLLNPSSPILQKVKLNMNKKHPKKN